MKASRSRRVVTSETSMFNTNREARWNVAPPLEHVAGSASIALFQPAGDLAVEHCVCGLAQLFETEREHFLLQSEIQIEREKKLVPWSLSPTQLSIVRAQCRGGIYPVACSTRKVEECGAV